MLPRKVTPSSVTNETCSLEIPQSGKLAVKSLKPFNSWHKTTAQYKDGKPLSYEKSDSKTEKQLFGLSFVQGRGCYYFVGTYADWDRISKTLDFKELPLGTKIDP